MNKLSDPIGDLLELAGAAKTAKARSELNQALEIARGHYDNEHEHQKQAPSVLFEQLDASIRKTLMLITKLGKYPDTRDIAFEQHPIGTGIADAATGREMIYEGRNLRISRRPWVYKGIRDRIRDNGLSADHIIVGINVESLLRAFQAHVGEQRRKKRGHPKLTGKSSVVFYAADFFRAYSPTKPTTHENNPFRPFVKRFFEIATGTKLSKPEWQIRQALGNYPDPRSVTFRWGRDGGEKRQKKDD